VKIKEIDNFLVDETKNKTEQTSALIYEIEIFAEDKLIGTSIIAGQVIIEELKKLVNQVFDEHYGFKRKTSSPRPNIDLNVEGHFMRFEAEYNETTKKIYRR
jgi:hypothetical protein